MRQVSQGTPASFLARSSGLSPELIHLLHSRFEAVLPASSRETPDDWQVELEELRAQNRVLLELYGRIAVELELKQVDDPDSVDLLKKIVRESRPQRPQMNRRSASEREKRPLPIDLPSKRTEPGRSGLNADVKVIAEGATPDLAPRKNRSGQFLKHLSKAEWRYHTRWLAFSSVIVALATVALVKFFDSRAGSNQTSAAPTTLPESALTPELPVSQFLEANNPDTISLDARMRVVRFMWAENAAARAENIFGGVAKTPLLEEFYQRPGRFAPQGCEKILEEHLYAQEGVPFLTIAASDKAGKTFAFTLLGTGSDLRIHWESSVGYSEQAWTIFQAEQAGKDVLMRVFLELLPASPQENAPIFGVQTIDLGSPVPVLVKKDTEVWRDLRNIVQTSPTARHPMVVSLRWTPGATYPEITALHHRYWIDFKSLVP